MASSAATFQQDLGAQIARLLGGPYKFYKSRLELRAQVPDGNNVIVLSGSNKYSPHISVSFYFGRNFTAAKEVEQLLGKHQFYYHIQQYSPNRNALKSLSYTGPYTWSVDIENPSSTLPSEIVDAIHGIADPFFDRFSTMTKARDAIAANDPWCFGGRIFWSQLLLLDLALGDLPHFEQWAKSLDEFSRAQAEETIAKYMAVKKSGV